MDVDTNLDLSMSGKYFVSSPYALKFTVVSTARRSWSIDK